MFQTDFYKVYIGYASGVIQCILRDILKGILLVKYKVLHPGIFGRFRVHGIIYSLDASYIWEL